MCLYQKSLDLVSVGQNKGSVLASHEMFKCKCCDCSEYCCKCFECLCCAPFITTITAEAGVSYDFVLPRCACRLDGNMIEAKETLRSNQLAVKKNKFSCKDFCMESVQLVSDVVDNAEIQEVVAAGEGLAGAVLDAKEAKDAVVEAMDAFADLKEKGYRKIGTTKSVWEINFPPASPPSQKNTTLLYVIEQYLVQV